jgi:hypothetical protein
VPVAKQILRIGEIVVAMPGNFVARSAVEHYGWQDKVTDDDAPPEEPTPQRRVRKKTR